MSVKAAKKRYNTIKTDCIVEIDESNAIARALGASAGYCPETELSILPSMTTGGEEISAAEYFERAMRNAMRARPASFEDFVGRDVAYDPDKDPDNY